MFKSGFNKAAFAKLQIYFPSMTESCSLEDITSMLNTGNLPREKFFYLYYKRESGDADLDVRKFTKYLRDTIEQEQI